MTCRSCGADLREGAMFCGECGARVASVVAAPAAPTVPIEPLHRTRAPGVQLPLTIDDFEATVLAPRRRGWVITGPDGVGHHIRVPTVIGRAPQRPDDRDDVQVLPLVDPGKSLSKSHAILEPDGDGLTIRDLGSTNGIVVVDASGNEVMLPTDTPIPVVAGTRFELGDFVLVVDRA
ncbi:hypothetical protein BH11ACT2_BH11ACT2_09020 [soil metagenome]